jgi:hypothetical protein
VEDQDPTSYHIPKKIMPPRPQSKDNGSQLKIMSGVMLFMTLELSGTISNHPAFFMRTQPSSVLDASQYTSKNFVMFGFANTGEVVSSFFKA